MSKITAFPATEQVTDHKIQKETILEYLKSFGFDKTLSSTEIQQFIQTALASNLDPFKREIYIAVYGDGESRKVSFLTGYQVYLKRAERTGKLDGWQAKLDGNGNQMKAIVEIFRKDWSHSFVHEVYWDEAVSKKKNGEPTQFWVKQPRFQLRKVAIAQAFRLAFPDELGGLPYESAELPEQSTGNDVQTIPINNENISVDSVNNVKTSISDSNTNLADEALDDSWTFGDSANSGLLNTTTQKNNSKEQDSDSEGDYLEKVVEQIESLFDANPNDFTSKHQAWILDKVHKAADNAGIRKMLAYTEKVIKKAA